MKTFFCFAEHQLQHNDFQMSDFCRSCSFCCEIFSFWSGIFMFMDLLKRRMTAIGCRSVGISYKITIWHHTVCTYMIYYLCPCVCASARFIIILNIIEKNNNWRLKMDVNKFSHPRIVPTWWAINNPTLLCIHYITNSMFFFSFFHLQNLRATGSK